MSSANDTCDFCHRLSPIAVCLCQFPMLKICDSCQVKHSETATGRGFHYSLPLVALTVITTKTEWLRRSRDIPQTLVAQGVLNASLQELDTLEVKVKTAYAMQEACLQRLRDEYLHAIQDMKVKAAEDIAEVARESQAHLLDINFTSMHPTAQWLNYFKQSAAEELELFGGDVQAGGEQELRHVFQLKLWTRLGNLTDGQYWSMKGLSENIEVKAEPVAENPQSKLEMEFAIESYANALESLKREKEALEGELQRKTQEFKQQVQEVERRFLKAASDNNELTKQLKAAQAERCKLRAEPEGLKLQEAHFQVSPPFAQTTPAIYSRKELPSRLVLRRIPSTK